MRRDYGSSPMKSAKLGKICKLVGLVLLFNVCHGCEVRCSAEH